MHNTTPIGFYTRAAVIALALITSAIGIYSVFNLNAIYAAAGLASLLVVLFPFLFIKSYDWFSTWTSVIIVVIYGGTAPAICMSLRWPDAVYVDEHILLNHPPEYFVYPSLLLLLGLAFCAIGYFSRLRLPVPVFALDRQYSLSRTYLVIGLLAIVSIGSLALYIRFTGGQSEETVISGKRTVIRTLDVQNEKDFSQYGYLRQGALLSLTCLLVLMSAWTERFSRLSVPRIAVLSFLFLVSCALPFYSSSRDQIVWNYWCTIGVLYYSGRPVFSGRSLAVLVGVVGVILFISAVRNERSDSTPFLEKMNSKLTPLLLNRHGPNVAKTAHILHSVPNPLGLKYGETIYVWLLAPIPREILPNKPMVSPGPIIGMEVYGTKFSGVPPGLVAEMFWNFHIVGIVLGCFLFGLFLRFVYEVFRAIRTDDGVVTPVYLFAMFPLGFQVLNNCLGGGVVMAMVDMVMSGFVVLLCTVRTRR
ncbi:MAG: O-antigen polymerase [Pirellulaceae bacterium]|nr:O-antigen polymerase [Pirellulaceae bacterium]